VTESFVRGWQIQKSVAIGSFRIYYTYIYMFYYIPRVIANAGGDLGPVPACVAGAALQCHGAMPLRTVSASFHSPQPFSEQMTKTEKRRTCSTAGMGEPFSETKQTKQTTDLMSMCHFWAA
jgi:hypothetical protein